MPKYIINKADQAVPLSGDVAGSAWARANVLQIEDYPWPQGNPPRPTQVRALWDDQNLYIQFLCEDKHISAVETRLNGNVYLDSCVEFFGMIDPATSNDYFNLEINCCGMMHLGYGPGRHGRRLSTPGIAQQMKIVTSVKGPTKQESPADDGWWVAAALPWEAISQLAGKKVSPRSGLAWRGNFYRCGGREVEYGVWSHIDNPIPDYHRPEFFGDIEFA